MASSRLLLRAVRSPPSPPHHPPSLPPPPHHCLTFIHGRSEQICACISRSEQIDEEYHEEGEIKEVQFNRRLKYKAVMEENTLINSSSSLVFGSEGESYTLAPDKSTLESENWGGDFCNSEEAALIVSKRMLADYYVKSSSEKEDSRKVLTLELYETHFGKSNVRQTLELEGSGLATRKVSWLFYPYLGKEDFERIFDQSVVEDEYSKLCEILDYCKCDPLVAIAERKVKVDQFSTLREHDLCDTLRQHKCSAERKVKADQFSKLREHDIYDDRTQLYPCSAKKEVEDFVQFSHRLDVLNSCFSHWGEGSDDLEKAYTSFFPLLCCCVAMRAWRSNYTT